jgi:hypothetical protein
MSSPKSDPQEENTSSSPFHLWSQIREARPAVRYTVYAGVGLMVTAESTFWFNVIKAKCFPSKVAGEKEKAEQFLQDLKLVVQGYKAVWMRNYGRHYSTYTWGLDYNGLDGLDETVNLKFIRT